MLLLAVEMKTNIVITTEDHEENAGGSRQEEQTLLRESIGI